MGLDTSHNCWHGSYGAFNRWRTKICEVAGYGKLDSREGFGGTVPWPDNDPLVKLLHHSDCEGEILSADCLPIAERLQSLIPALTIAGEGGGHVGNYAETTQQFIDGLKRASAANENVDFH